MIKLFLTKFGALVSPIFEREEGQTLAEYALILALIAVAVVGAVIFLGGDISSLFNSVSSDI
ncbi:MAG TPA: Flp family type IVb pilin [Gaiellaceae bacterium]|nr:Flp family type IVb pilin [Gaiellaceae bacterium]